MRTVAASTALLALFGALAGCVGADFVCAGGQYVPEPHPCQDVGYCKHVDPGFYGPTSDGQARHRPCGQNECPRGHYCGKDASSPTPCQKGHYAPDPGKTACRTCDPGYYCVSTGRTSQVPCPARHFCPSTKEGPKDCRGGFYCPEQRQAETQCEAGFYCPPKSASETPCPPGSLCPHAGMSSYTPCPAGSFCSSGATAATPCPTGSFCPASSAAPLPCYVGSSCPFANLTQPVPCPLGHYQDQPSATDCKPCDPGSAAPGKGMATCQPCPAGTFSAGGGNASSCDLCAAGRFGNASSATTASCAGECPAGYYCPAGVVSAFARPCGGAGVYCPPGSGGPFLVRGGFRGTPPGNVTTQTNESACEPGHFCVNGQQVECLPGTEAPEAGATACAECAAGTASGLTGGADTCAPCEPGTATASNRSSACQPCARGESSTKRGATSCTLCEPGTFSADANSTSCTPCAAGNYTDTAGSPRCIECPPGSAIAEQGGTACAACNVHEFANASGLTSCHACPSGEFATNRGSQYCSTCPPQDYLVFPNRSDPSSFEGCRPCPTGASCVGGLPTPFAGYWTDVDPVSGEFRVYACLSEEACPEGGRCGAGRVLPVSSNPLCARCKAGYQIQSGRCEPCDGVNGLALFGVAALVVVFTLFYHRISQAGTAHVTIYFYFLQVVGLLVTTSTTDTDALVNLARLLNVDFSPATGSSCVAPMSDKTRILLPYVWAAALFATWGVVAATSAVLRGRGRGRNAGGADVAPFGQLLEADEPAAADGDDDDYNKDAVPRAPLVAYSNCDWAAWRRSAVALYVLTFNGVVSASLAVFRCRTITLGGEPMRVVHNYPTVSCTGPAYAALASVAGVVCTLYAVAVPALLFYAMHRPNPSRSLAFLTEHFSERHRYWLLVFLLRRAALVAVVVFLEGARPWQMTAAALVAAATLLWHVLARPFRRHVDNAMECLSLFVILVLAVLLSPVDVPYSDVARVFIAIIWIAPLSVLTAWVGVHYARKARAWRDKAAVPPGGYAAVNC